jgi:1-acyl-sn-glycerol-3-phosphate acyltransferase
MKFLAKSILFLIGWRMDTKNPTHQRCVLIAAPHTSNWDFLMMMLFSAAFGVKTKWMGKKNLFVPPFGFLFRALGGVPVKRDRQEKLVATMVELFSQRENLMLAVPVEGTRAYIASGAKVPILPTFLDYGQKIGGFGQLINLTGCIKTDMQALRDFYKPYIGKYPKNSGPIRLREED